MSCFIARLGPQLDWAIRGKCKSTDQPEALLSGYRDGGQHAEFGDSRREVTSTLIRVTDREDKCRFNIVTCQPAE